MGQAKHRGSREEREERAAAARRRTTTTTPPALVCNHCQTELPQAEQMDASSLRGIELAFKAHCEACDQDTWAVRGDSAAVRAFYDALEKAAGQRVQLGKSRAPGST